MSSDIVVSVEGLYKQFNLPVNKNTTLKQAFVNIIKRNGKVTQQVLGGISFSVDKGDFFGIVGRNGSGKSTLLKILAGVYTPTSGRVAINGSLTPFIELGVGFNPELSGRDNVYLNGALLGFNRKQMDVMYDEIVEFAELGPFMGQKLKNYSSGMQVRLAFSIAIKAKNDVLIFDEVLAVGDEAFQQKCLDVFERYKAEGQTVILVTHSMATVRRFCNRALLIDGGKIVKIGDPRLVANEYSRLNQEDIDRNIKRDNEKAVHSKYLEANVTDEKNNKRQSFAVGGKMNVNMSWNGLNSSNLESLGVSIFKQSGEHITGINSRTAGHPKGWKDKGKISLEFDLNLTAGKYFVVVEAFKKEGELIDAIYDGPVFSVINQNMPWSGLVELSHKWIEG